MSDYYKELTNKLRITGMTEGHCELLLNTADAIEKLVTKCHQLEKERNAAVDDLKTSAECEYCKWLVEGDCTDSEHEECNSEHWEWRGANG